MKITIPALAAVISLAVFACSESPYSHSSSPSGACRYLGEASFFSAGMHRAIWQTCKNSKLIANMKAVLG
jgi:hypothetical protein